MALRFDVLVQQHLLARNLSDVVELRRSPVVGIGYRTAAVNAVLLPSKVRA